MAPGWGIGHQLEFSPSPITPPASNALSVLSDGTVTPLRKQESGWRPGLLSGWLSCPIAALGCALCQRPLGWLILRIHPGSMAFPKGHLGGVCVGEGSRETDTSWWMTWQPALLQSPLSPGTVRAPCSHGSQGADGSVLRTPAPSAGKRLWCGHG